MNQGFPPDGDAPSEGTDMQDLLRRITIIEHNQRDMLFLLRSQRLALHNVCVELSPETRRIHREIIRLEPFNGRCPCCLQTRVVSAEGALIPPVEFDHFLGSVYSAPVHSWLICRPCHVALTNDRHLTWYHRLITRFRVYQAAAEAYTVAFGNRRGSILARTPSDAGGADPGPTPGPPRVTALSADKAPHAGPPPPRSANRPAFDTDRRIARPRNTKAPED